MFGEPDANDRRPGLAATEERVAWWADVFEAPCVGYAGALDEVAPLVQAGADFVALGDFLWSDPSAAATHGRRSRPAHGPAGAHGMRRARRRTGRALAAFLVGAPTPAVWSSLGAARHQAGARAKSARCRQARSKQDRSRLWRLPARLLSDRFRRGDEARRAGRSGGHDPAGRTLRAGLRHRARRRQGGRVVQARRRPRRPQRHVRARHVEVRGPRRAARWRGGRAPARPGRQARPAARRLRSRPLVPAGPASRRRISARPPRCSRRPPPSAIRRRNTRWRPCTKKGAASRRTSTRRWR